MTNQKCLDRDIFRMDHYFKTTMWSLLLLALILGIFAASIEAASLKSQNKNHLASPHPVIFVTPSPEDDEPGAKPQLANFRSDAVKPKEASRRNNIPPSKFSSSPLRKDQLRLPSNQNYRRPSKESPPHVLSSARDTSLSNPEQLEKLDVPATYESIVYNPHTKEASTAFSQSNFWETPELIVRDVNQRQQGKNSFVTTSSRQEYTPNFKSVQTPLNQIQYRGYNQPKTQPYRRPTPQTSPQAPIREEEDEEESQSEGVEEDHEEVSEGDDEDGLRHTYPVNLQEQRSFHPFENVQEPEDIYSDVLSNIGSVFNDDHSSLPPQTSSPDPTGARNLLPEFEQYSFENLQQQERDDVREDDENEEINEYDDDEREESKQVPLQKPKELPKYTPSPKNTVHRPVNGKQVKESPFPNVKIVKDRKPPPQQPAPFTSWLPTQPPTKPKPWPLTSQRPFQQNRQQSAPQIQQQRPQWKKPTSPKPRPPKKPQQKGDIEPYNDSYKESHNDDTEPYNESYKSSYNKSWKSSSPETDEDSSYHTSWEDSKPTKPTHETYKKEQKYSSSNQEEDRLKQQARPRKSPNNLIQSPSKIQEVIRRSDSEEIDSNSQPKDNIGTFSNNIQKTSSNILVDDTAVDKIDELYNNQHNQV